MYMCSPEINTLCCDCFREKSIPISSPINTDIMLKNFRKEILSTCLIYYSFTEV